MSKRTRILRKDIERLNLALDLETEETLKRMIEYLRYKNISTCERLSIQRDIAQLLLDAQEEGRSLDEVIGSDHAAFCEALINALPESTQRERQLMTLRTVFSVLALLWFCCIIYPGLGIFIISQSTPSWMLIEPINFQWTEMPVYLNMIIAFVVAFVLIMVVQVLDWKYGWTAKIYLRKWGKLSVIVLFCLIGVIPWPGDDDLFSILGEPVAYLHIGVCLFIMAVFVGIFLWLRECIDNRRCPE